MIFKKAIPAIDVSKGSNHFDKYCLFYHHNYLFVFNGKYTQIGSVLIQTYFKEV